MSSEIPAEPAGPEPSRSRRLARSAIALCLLHVAAGIVFLSPGYIRPDSVGVYAYLRSAVIDRDLLFFNEWERFGLVRDGITAFKEVTPAGALADHWWIGTSILSAPFYVAAHGVASLIGQGGDGFFGLYGATLAWCSVLFGVLVFLLADSLLRRLTPALTAARRWMVLAAVWVGTPLFWYEYRFPLGTHLAGALCVGLLCPLLLRPDGRGNGARLGEATGLVLGAATGLAIGMAIATRIQHAVLIPAVVFGSAAMGRSRKFYLGLLLGAALPLAAQGLSWWVVYGNPLGPLASGANLEGSTWLPFRRVALVAVLVSSWHGLFSWSPVAIFAVTGWLVALRTKRAAALTLILMFAGEWLANGLFDRYFWGGMSFGPRRFVDLAVPFALGIGWFLESARRWPAPAAIFASSAWSLGLAGAVLTGALDLSADPGLAGLVRAVFSPSTWTAFSRDLLHSSVTDAALFWQSILALAVISAIVFAILALARFRRLSVLLASAYLGACCVVLLSTWEPTRERAPAEIARLGIDRVRASRTGPLLDQKNLLAFELAHHERLGDAAAAAALRAEIGRIDALLAQPNSR